MVITRLYRNIPRSPSHTFNVTQSTLDRLSINGAHHELHNVDARLKVSICLDWLTSINGAEVVEVGRNVM